MKKILTSLLIAFAMHGAFAQSDNCVTATSITPSTGSCTPVPGTSAGATQSMPGCTGTADDDVWYQFVATSSQHYLTVEPSINYDAVVEVFSGSCGALNSMNCIDGGSVGGTESVALTGLTSGATYYFRVYEYSAGSGSNTFTVCLYNETMPANDDCAFATSIASSTSTNCTAPVTGSSFGGTESMTACTGTADDDVWYKFTATAVSHSLSVTGSTGYDAVVETFTGSCGSLTSTGCNDNAGQGGEEDVYLAPLNIGTTYYFRVYSYSSTTSPNTFSICLTVAAVQAPPNDECTGSFTVPVTSPCSPTQTVISSVGATQSMTGCAGNADDDVWLTFTPTNANQNIYVTGDATSDAVVELFSGNCGSLTSLSCTDIMGTGVTETVKASGLIVGQPYYARIYDYYSGGKTFTVSVVTRELNIAATATNICQGHSVTLTASGTPTFTWTGGVVNGVAFTPTVSNTYTVSGIGAGSCLNTAYVTVNVSSPQTPDICMVTVDTMNVNNVIYWDKNYYNVDSFIVYREVTANVYRRIGAVNDLAFSRFVDTARSIGFRNGDPNIRSYKYKLQIRDTCGNYSAMSPYHTSLFMNNTGNVFTWNFYDIENQTSPVSNYEVYRDDNNTGAFNLIGTVGGSVNTFTDNTFSSVPNGKWAVLADGFSCSPSFKGASIANVMATINRSKSNVKNNLAIPPPPADPPVDGIFEANKDQVIILVPNPANVFTEITTALPVQTVRVYNYLGELVYTMDAGSQQKIRLDLQSLNSGVYNIELTGKNMRATRKLVVNR